MVAIIIATTSTDASSCSCSYLTSQMQATTVAAVITTAAAVATIIACCYCEATTASYLWHSCAAEELLLHFVPPSVMSSMTDVSLFSVSFESAEHFVQGGAHLPTTIAAMIAAIAIASAACSVH